MEPMSQAASVSQGTLIGGCLPGPAGFYSSEQATRRWAMELAVHLCGGALIPAQIVEAAGQFEQYVLNGSETK